MAMGGTLAAKKRVYYPPQEQGFWCYRQTASLKSMRSPRRRQATVAAADMDAKSKTGHKTFLVSLLNQSDLTLDSPSMRLELRHLPGRSPCDLDAVHHPMGIHHAAGLLAGCTVPSPRRSGVRPDDACRSWSRMMALVHDSELTDSGPRPGRSYRIGPTY